MASASQSFSRPFVIAIGFASAWIFSLGLVNSIDAQEISQAERAIAQTADSAQKNDDFKLAAQQWDSLIKQFPNSEIKGLAEHNLGICYVKLGNFEQAIQALKGSLTSLGKKETEKLATSYLFLGFSQAKRGLALLENGTTKEDQEQANLWLTTSTQTFDQLQRRFPDFADLDQAFFFQGQAYSNLERFEKAAESYERMSNKPDGPFRFDGLISLGETYEQLAQYDKAIECYDKFTTEATASGGNALQSEVDFLKGKLLLKLANSADTDGRKGLAEQRYSKAEELLLKSANTDSFAYRHDALFKLAVAYNLQRKFAESAKVFAQVAEIPGYDRAAPSRVYAGRDYLSAQQIDAAEAELNKAIAMDNDSAATGAHWLAQVYLRTRRNQEAFDLAESWIGKMAGTAGEHPSLTALKLDRADAAYMIDEKRPQSSALYLELADKHPDDRLAPTALYNAAFALLETGKFDDAIKVSDRFVAQFPNDSYLPDILEVKADASLLAGQPKVAESVFRKLTQDFAANEKSSTWNVRLGLAKYMQNDYQGTIDWLTPVADVLTDKRQLAEALHWIGSSYFKLNNDEKAIVALQQSHNTDPAWQRADETMLLLSQSLQRAGRGDEAARATKSLTELYAKSSAAAKATYQLGDMAYEKGNWAEAQANYQAIIDKYPDSDLAPHALYGIAWSLIEQKQYKQATEVFDLLAKEFPGHERAAQSMIGRGASLRLAGKPSEAKEVIFKYLETKPTGKSQIDAFYELGLSQIDLEEWENVSKTFGVLLQQDQNSKLADRYHYEIAWANLSLDNKEAALSHFKTLVENHGDSPLAPEAHFHLANKLYEEKQYAEAAKTYGLASASETSSASLREKAAYKRAWSHYKLKDYEKALSLFKEQVDQFPQGSLHTDGLLMVSDSLYRMEQHEKAFEAYRVAKPAIEASKTVDARVRWQAFIQGGQSANKSGKHNEAIEFVDPVIQSDATSDSLKQEAWLEVGNANKGLGNLNDAVSAWKKAAINLGETGAEARCMIGEAYFEQGKFDDAINAYKLVFYGYGGKDSVEEVKPWQAFAAFEAAQCNYVRIKEAPANLRDSYINEAKKLFQYLVDNYPDDTLTGEARKRLQTLSQLK